VNSRESLRRGREGRGARARFEYAMEAQQHFQGRAPLRETPQRVIGGPGIALLLPQANFS